MGKKTDHIFQEIKSGIKDENSVSFIDEITVRNEIRCDMEAQFPSLSKFANCCSINASHLCEFYKGTKNIGRDNLLCIFINLHYDLDKIQTMLHRLNVSELYVRNKRDYQIALGINEQKTLAEIDDILITKELEPLQYDFKNKENRKK